MVHEKKMNDILYVPEYFIFICDQWTTTFTCKRRPKL